MSALYKVLEAYRDMFGVKTDRANEIHREACIEVARLQEIEKAAQEFCVEHFSEEHCPTCLCDLPEHEDWCLAGKLAAALKGKP